MKAMIYIKGLLVFWLLLCATLVLGTLTKVLGNQSGALILCPDLYTKPPKSAIPGARIDRRTIALTTAQVANSNIVALGVLPAGCRLHGFYLESDDLDSGANTITLDLGVLNTYYNQAEATVAVPADYDSGGVTNTGT